MNGLNRDISFGFMLMASRGDFLRFSSPGSGFTSSSRPAKRVFLRRRTVRKLFSAPKTAPFAWERPRRGWTPQPNGYSKTLISGSLSRNLTGTSTRAATARPPAVAGWNVHLRTAATAARSRSASPELRSTSTSATRPCPVTVTSSRTVPSRRDSRAASG